MKENRCSESNEKKYKVVFVFFALLIYLPNLIAAVPTMEGIFSNSSNPDVTNQLTIINLVMDNEQQDPSLTKNYIKIFVYKTKNKHTSYQIQYSGQKMDVPIKVINMKGFDKTSNIQDVSKRSFRGLIEYFFYNDSRNLLSMIDKISPDFNYNSEIIDEEKRAMMEKYKSYLAAVSKNPSLKSELKSPLNSENMDERRFARDMMEQSIYKSTTKIRIEKIESEFFWRLSLDNVKALFEMEKHQLKELFFTIKDGEEIKWRFGDYILFDGVHFAPESFAFEMFGKTYRFKVAEVKQSDIAENEFEKIISKLEDECKKNIATNQVHQTGVLTTPVPNTPPFMNNN